MPINKKRILAFSIPLFLLVLFSILLFKLFPVFKTQADEASVDPVLIDLLLTPATIDTEHALDSVVLYARASTAEPGGSITISASIAPENGCSGSDCSQPQAQTENLTLMTEGCDALGALNVEGLEGGCGDATDGIFMATFDLPRYSAIGDWKVYMITLDEGVGDNGIEIPISVETMTATTLEGEKNIAFVNEALVADTQAPTIDDYVLDPASIDTTSAGRQLKMYARVSDDLTSVSAGSPFRILFSPDDDPGFVNTESTEFSFALMESGCDSLPAGLDVSGLDGGCGDATDGIYEATVTIPRYSTGGTWSAVGVYDLSDIMGNSSAEDASSASFTNTSEVYDTEVPVINAISITPSTFDTTDGEQIITFEMEITDDYAGVAKISVGLVPIVTGMAGGIWVEDYTLLDGTTTDGTFSVEITLPEGAAQGFWKVNNIDVGDVLLREQRYTTTQLSLSFPDLTLYLLNQGTTEEVTLTNDWTLEDWPHYVEGSVVWPDISIKFDAGTVITKEEGGVFAFDRMLTTKYNLEEGGNLNTLLSGINSDYDEDLLGCDESEGCVDTSVSGNNLVGTPLHVIKVGIAGLNLSFSKPVTISIGVDPEYLGSTFVIQTFDTESGAWVNHGTCTVAMIEPETTEYGGTAYGVTRPVSYAGCQFTTDHASFFSANVLGVEDDRAGVPETGFGGLSNNLLRQYFEWVR